jgi:hypothetical protein
LSPPIADILGQAVEADYNFDHIQPLSCALIIISQ